MLTSGLTNTPLTKLLLIYTIASSVALSILDLKHLPTIHVVPHVWQYGQFWRLFIWQIAGFTNSTEALFAAMLAYHLRVVERAWGKRKMATFILTTLPFTTFLPPLLLMLVLRPLSLNRYNYLPSGPTATIFALLAQYHASIPHTFRYRVSTGSAAKADPLPPATTTDYSGAAAAAAAATTSADGSATTATTTTTPTGKRSLTVFLSDKSTTYLVAAQLACSQFPTMVLPAVVGWLVGLAWRMELLPGLSPAATGWRVPAWVVGERETRRRVAPTGDNGDGDRYRDLRRRLEGEAVAAAAAAAASGVGQSSDGQRQRHRSGME
ncbi:hypothetical protein FE257_009416 [Aspergillus nanangensis]|uniref:UBA domain-containing protein Ucp14 n=1 Tax=Aspergillus nanangensis TaxID=2582783 RepID=A0AAD4GSX2_ASPNN|nr:hypothetical protein FE257_009416 [Aspergillus nanangensis]